MQFSSDSLLFGALIVLVSFLVNLIVVLLVRKSIRNDKMSKMISMQQAAFRTESASALDRMRTSAKECQQEVDVASSHAGEMVRQISDSLRTLSEYQDDLTALQMVCSEYRNALEKLRIATDQAEARISAVQEEVRKVESVNDRMDSFRQEAERTMNELQDMKAEYVRLVAATQESLRSAAEGQKSENEEMLASFSSSMERTRDLFSEFVASERADFKAFSDSELKKAEDMAVDVENRRDSIVQTLESSKASAEAFGRELEGRIAELADMKSGIEAECSSLIASFRSSAEGIAEESRTAIANAFEESRKSLGDLSAAAEEGMERQRAAIASEVESLSGRIDASMKEKEDGMSASLEAKKGELEEAVADAESRIRQSSDGFEVRFRAEEERLSASIASFSAAASDAEEAAKGTVAEALRNIEAARTALDSDRSQFIAASRDAISRSFSEMLSGIDERYGRMKEEGDSFVKALADRTSETRETITLLAQGEQERIQESVERLQELERKIRASEEQLQKLAETITDTKEELFSAQQERGKLDSEIEERNRTLASINEEMRKSKSARINEEAELVRLKLQVSNLQKKHKDELQKDAAASRSSGRKPEEMIEEFPDDIFTGEIEEVDLGDEE